MYGVTTALLSTNGLRLVSFPPSYRTKLGSCLETAEPSTLCLKSKSKRGITNQKTGIFGISRRNLFFYALGGEEGCSNLKIIVSKSRMSMSLMWKFGNQILRYILHTFGSNLFKNYRSFWESEILVWDKDVQEKDLVKRYKLPFSVCPKRDFKTLKPSTWIAFSFSMLRLVVSID